MEDLFEYEDKNLWPRKEGDFKLIHSEFGLNVMVKQKKWFLDDKIVECYAFLPPDEVRRLRDWLNNILKKDSNNER